jgi:hypothetical protein
MDDHVPIECSPRERGWTYQILDECDLEPVFRVRIGPYCHRSRLGPREPHAAALLGPG